MNIFSIIKMRVCGEKNQCRTLGEIRCEVPWIRGSVDYYYITGVCCCSGSVLLCFSQGSRPHSSTAFHFMRRQRNANNLLPVFGARLFLNLAARFRGSPESRTVLRPVVWLAATARSCDSSECSASPNRNSAEPKSQLQASSPCVQQIKEKCFMLGGPCTIGRQHIVMQAFRARRQHDDR